MRLQRVFWAAFLTASLLGGLTASASTNGPLFPRKFVGSAQWSEHLESPKPPAEYCQINGQEQPQCAWYYNDHQQANLHELVYKHTTSSRKYGYYALAASESKFSLTGSWDEVVLFNDYGPAEDAGKRCSFHVNERRAYNRPASGSLDVFRDGKAYLGLYIPTLLSYSGWSGDGCSIIRPGLQKNPHSSAGPFRDRGGFSWAPKGAFDTFRIMFNYHRSSNDPGSGSGQEDLTGRLDGRARRQ